MTSEKTARKSTGDLTMVTKTRKLALSGQPTSAFAHDEAAMTKTFTLRTEHDAGDWLTWMRDRIGAHSASPEIPSRAGVGTCVSEGPPPLTRDCRRARQPSSCLRMSFIMSTR